jgi:hypothetical protein
MYSIEKCAVQAISILDVIDSFHKLQRARVN